MRLLLRVAVSAALLGVLAARLDARALGARLVGMRAGWALLALAISVPQVALSAWRWRLTAARLGIALPYRAALREYYLATFLNQVLPGAVMGDVSRAVRHGRDTGGMGAATKAVVLERASGQIVVLTVAALSLLALPVTLGTGARATLAGAAFAVALLAGTLVGVRRRAAGWAGSLGRDAHAALLARDVILRQLLASVLVVASYVGMYCAAARAVRAATPLTTLAPLVAPVLVSMLVPATVAGWGIREAAAATLWRAVGLAAADGVAISAAYGLLVLLSSLPGALVLLSAGRGRRADPDPSGSGGTADGAPGRGSRSAGG